MCPIRPSKSLWLEIVRPLGRKGRGCAIILREHFLTDPYVHEIFMPVALEHLFEDGKLIPGGKLPD
jgi:hypothetical protein